MPWLCPRPTLLQAGAAMADTAATGASGQPRPMLPRATAMATATEDTVVTADTATGVSGQPRPSQAMAMVDMADTEATAAMATGASVQPMLRLSLRPSPRLKPTLPPWPTPPLMPTLGATEDTTEATEAMATAMAGAKGLLRLMPGATEATGADIGEATGEVTDITAKSNWMGKPQDRP